LTPSQAELADFQERVSLLEGQLSAAEHGLIEASQQLAKGQIRMDELEEQLLAQRLDPYSFSSAHFYTFGHMFFLPQEAAVSLHAFCTTLLHPASPSQFLPCSHIFFAA
jgi:uncharacterized coiled-coil protein SlyX